MPNGNEGKPLGAAMIVQIRKLRAQRFAIRRIAALCGVSPTTVMCYLHRDSGHDEQSPPSSCGADTYDDDDEPG